MTTTIAQALNRALDDALASDERVIVMGEDVGRTGGVFRITDGLRDRHGSHRVIDTPVAESGSLDRGDLKRTAELVDNKCRKRFALDILSDQHKRLRQLRDLLQDRMLNPAGHAPGRPAIYQNRLIGFKNHFFEIGFINFLNMSGNTDSKLIVISNGVFAINGEGQRPIL